MEKINFDIGWVNSWVISDKEQTHPSHRTAIITIKELQHKIYDLMEFVDKNWPCCGCGNCLTKKEVLVYLSDLSIELEGLQWNNHDFIN